MLRIRMGPAGSSPVGGFTRPLALAAALAALLPHALLPQANGDEVLHELAARSGHKAMWAAETHPGTSAHLESLLVRSHACAVGCYLSSRVQTLAPAAPSVMEAATGERRHSAAAPFLPSSSSRLPPASRAPPQA